MLAKSKCSKSSKNTISEGISPWKSLLDISKNPKEVRFSISEFLRGNILTGFPWNLISYTWSWSVESIQILSLIGTYALSLISVSFFCLPFLFIKNTIVKKKAPQKWGFFFVKSQKKSISTSPRHKKIKF